MCVYIYVLMEFESESDILIHYLVILCGLKIFLFKFSRLKQTLNKFRITNTTISGHLDSLLLHLNLNCTTNASKKNFGKRYRIFMS